MVNIPILVGVALVAAGSVTMAAGFGAFDEWAGDQRECPWHITVPLAGSGHGTLRMTFNNSVAPFPVRVCAFDDDGFRRIDRTFEIPVSEAHEVMLDVPSGPFLFVIEFNGPYEERSVMNSIIEPEGCAGAALAKEFPVGEEASYAWYGLRPATCIASGAVVELERPDSEGSSMSLGSLPLAGRPGVGFGSVLTVAGLMTIGIAKSSTIAFGTIALFSRLVRPRLLDQPTRSQILDLVEMRPGIRFVEIAKSLELGQGSALHHLRVLAREHLLSRVGHAYFVTGQHTRDEMRRINALEAPAARAFYDAAKTHPTRASHTWRASSA